MPMDRERHGHCLSHEVASRTDLKEEKCGGVDGYGQNRVAVIIAWGRDDGQEWHNSRERKGGFAEGRFFPCWPLARSGRGMDGLRAPT